MQTYFTLHLDATRGDIKSIQDVAFQRRKARTHIKLSLVPPGNDQIITEEMIPDFLVTDQMVDRWLQIEPPTFRVTSDFDPIFEAIEDAYVTGEFFSALAAAVVTVERILNTARMDLHPHPSISKISGLWGKGPTNDWEPNISALLKWGYLSQDLVDELRQLFGVRCNYLHSGSLARLETDSFRAIDVAYRLLKELVGFPAHLFGMENGSLKILGHPGIEWVNRLWK